MCSVISLTGGTDDHTGAGAEYNGSIGLVRHRVDRLNGDATTHHFSTRDVDISYNYTAQFTCIVSL